MSTLDDPTCCEQGCLRPAMYEILGGSGHPEDATLACEAHVGVLLGTPVYVKAENRQWTIVRLASDA